MIQKSLVLLKPDTLKRGIVGEILHRFERAGLKIVGMKIISPDPSLVSKHYSTNDENLKNMGTKTLEDCASSGIDVMENVGTTDPVEIGRKIWQWNVDFLSNSPVIALVLEGNRAIENIRTMVGHTVPTKAQPGTIRGDYSIESSAGANMRQRTIYNLVHASATPEEAAYEISLWFKPEELVSYKRIHEEMYSY